MKQLSLLLTFILLAILTACNNENGTEVKNENTTNEEVSIEQTTESANENGELNWIVEYDNVKLSYVGLWTSDMDNGFEITKESAEFINSNNNLFPSKDKSISTSLLESNANYKNINKSPDKYLSSIIHFSGQIVQIYEEDIENIGTVTEIYMYDDNLQGYHILYLGALPDVFEEDSIYVTGLPLGLSGFDNTSGGFTNTIVTLGSYIEKVE